MGLPPFPRTITTPLFRQIQLINNLVSNLQHHCLTPSTYRNGRYSNYWILSARLPRDLINSWFIEVGATFFCRPLARLFNLSIATSIVPNQWKAAYIRHLTRHSFRTSLADLIEDADDNLFNSILYNNEHVLNRILPIKTESTYQLRPRRHNRSLTIKANATNECDFIVRMLSKDIY